MVLEGEPNPEVFEIKLCGVGDESRNDPFGDKSAISVNTSLSMRGVYNRRGVVLRNGDGDKNVDGDNDADSDGDGDANKVRDVGIGGRGRPFRQHRSACGTAVPQRHRVDAVLRYDLCPSGPRG